jgi:hypothetical protein
MDYTTGIQFPAGTGIILFATTVPRRPLGVYTASYSDIEGVKQPELVTDHSTIREALLASRGA